MALESIKDGSGKKSTLILPGQYVNRVDLGRVGLLYGTF